MVRKEENSSRYKSRSALLDIEDNNIIPISIEDESNDYSNCKNEVIKQDKQKDKFKHIICHTINDNKEVPLLYLYIFKYMNKAFENKRQVVFAKNMIEVLHRHIYHLPRCYDYHIFSEMCTMHLMKRVNTQKYEFYGGKDPSFFRKLEIGVREKKIDNSPIIYTYIYKELIELYGRKNQTLTTEQIVEVWKKHIPNISKIYYNDIIAEMCNYGMFYKINSQRYIFYGARSNVRLMKLQRYFWN